MNAGLALAKGENAAAQAAGAMTSETMGILSHSLYSKTPEELTETEKQKVSALSQLAGGISTSNGVFLNKEFIPTQPTRVPFHSLTQNGVYLPTRNLFTVN